MAQLRLLVAEHPFTEYFHTALVECLFRIGRRNDAIEAYRAFRALLRDELGVDPARQAQLLYPEIIASEAPARPIGVVPALP